MAETPRTDAIDVANDSLDRVDAYAKMRGHARTLERELNTVWDALERVTKQRDDAEALALAEDERREKLSKEWGVTKESIR